MMNCPHCGKSVVKGTAFCVHCGSPLPTGTATPIPQVATITSGVDSAFAEQKRKQNMILGIVAVAAILLAIIGGKAISNALGFGAKSPNEQVLQAKAKSPSEPLLQATGKQEGTSLAQTAQAPLEMPADVEAWLRHLEKCEAMKIQIGGDQSAEVSLWIQKNQALGAGMGLTDPYDQAQGDDADKAPNDYTKGKILDLRPKWQELIDFFRSVPPPEECRPLADDFDRAVSEIPGMMGDMGDILNQASTDPTAAMQGIQKMKSGSYANIDRYFARADEKLGAICAKYNKTKWFNIKQDVGGGGVLGKVPGL
jgi:zinc-ribbon domain